MRSPPKSRPLRPAATRDQHDSPATTHCAPHARHPPSAHITMDAPRRTRMRARVALTCIYTAHTTHSRHRLPLAARFHSNARAPADTFLVPARSPRKTRPSRRPPRSARPLVRPTSFMRTTTPAKAPPMMNRLRCAQALFTNAKGRQQPAVLLAKGMRLGNRAMIAPVSSLCLACPRHAPVLSE